MRVSVEIAAAADDEAIRGLLKRQPFPAVSPWPSSASRALRSDVRSPVRIRWYSWRAPTIGKWSASRADRCATSTSMAGPSESAISVNCESTSAFAGAGWFRAGSRSWPRSTGAIRSRPTWCRSPKAAMRPGTSWFGSGARRFPNFMRSRVTHARVVVASPTDDRRGPTARTWLPGSIEQIPEIVEFLRAEGARRQLFPVWSAAMLRDLSASASASVI